eukprot:jgi/Chrzof1/2940/Cz12g05070.t1
MAGEAKFVAVIGSGVAGLSAAKELLQEGHRVVVFERSSSIGGIWNYSPDREVEDLLGLSPDRNTVHSSMYVDVQFEHSSISKSV